MVHLTGYRIHELIYESPSSRVYRGQRERDGQAVILKELNAAYPSPDERFRYRQEYELTHTLGLEGVITAYSLESHQHTLVIVFEDFGTQSLQMLLKAHPLSLEEFLTIAIRIADSLAHLHAANIIHKDINPSNIVLNPATGQLKLIDFGIATRLSREHPTIKHPNVLEGTLAYMSPEQTGRMNRSLDSRTDLYSLGVTLYELLTGHLPFVSDDPLELVHGHLAKMPVPPCELSPHPDPLPEGEGVFLPSPRRRRGRLEQSHRGEVCEVPHILSDIIMKLLAKTAEDRYQSAGGLHADLQQCLDQLQVTGTTSSFELGRYDVTPRFQIPDTLYGRAQETQTILQAFQRVRAGSTELLLVTGAAGVGKSSLVHEVHPPMTAARGFFMAGKFDQYQRHIPYAALLQAFQDGLTLVLGESEARLTAWRTTLLQAVGQNGKVLTEVLPNLELIIGPQPEIAQLSPTDTQYRFNAVFGNFVKTLAQPEHPLVLFLDDLQWADSASLNLLKVLMTDPDLRYLLCIGAYRDQEVSRSHPLIMTIEELRQAQVVITTMPVADLSLEHVSDLLSDTLHQPNGVHDLAQVISAKTHGNAFFVKQVLHALYDEEVLHFDHHDHQWHWDQAAMQQVSITDNVVELMMAKLQRLPAETHRLLTLAACIGNRFDGETLAVIAEHSPHDTAQALHAALVEGLLLPAGGLSLPEDLDQAPVQAAYRFAHDKIQEAAYALIPQEEKAGVHRTIGTLLRAHLPEDQQEERIFDLVNQLNWGRTAIERLDEAVTLADLNLRAGRKAKASAAYQPALRYVTIGTELLPKDSWDTRYPLTFTLYRERYEGAYLTGRVDEAERLRAQILPRTTSRVEQAEIYNVGIIYYTMTSRTKEAVDMGRDALKLFGVELPDRDFRSARDRELEQVSINLGTRTCEDLLHFPITADSAYRVLISLLVNLRPSVHDTNPDLYEVLSIKMMNITLTAGTTTKETPTVYAQHGKMLAGLGEYQAAYDFGKLAMQLSERLDDAYEKARTFHLVANNINHWWRPLASSVTLAQQAFRYAQEPVGVGMAKFGWTFISLIRALLSKGETLGIVLNEIDTALHYAARTRNTYVYHDCIVFRHFVLTLQGRTPEMSTFTDLRIDASQLLNAGKEHLTKIHRGIAYLLPVIRLQAYYAYEQYYEALEMATKAEQIQTFPEGSLLKVEQNFYGSLTRTALYPTATPEEQQQYLDTLHANQAELQIWAENCPENFRHRYLLIEAERARIDGRHWDAVTGYRQAIEAAHAQEFIHHEALGNELLAKFWLSQGEEKLAHVCMIDARYGYQLWGASGKVRDLEQKYPQLLTTQAPCAEMPDIYTTVHLTGSRSNDALDFATVLKASQAIADELVLENLLTRVMDIVRENAGADHGLLLFEEAGAWVVKAGTEAEQCPFPTAIINYVNRTKTPVVLADATHDGQFTQDPYVLAHQPKSVLCTPLLHQGQLVGILYLENRLTTGAFTPDRVDVLHMLSAQAAISIEHASLYDRLEHKVADRTQELADTIDRLEQEIMEREAAEAALQTYREHLEELVEERTAELSRANDQLRQEIAERQRAELAVRASEQQYRALAENVADGIVILREGKSVFVNEALCSMIGYTADHLLRFEPVALFRDEYRNAFTTWCEQLMEGVPVPNLQAVCLTRDGREIWTEERSSLIEWEGQPAILVAIRDITERKFRELEMEKKREHLQKENIALRSTIKDRYKFGDLVGKSPAMQEVYELVAHASATEANVVIFGESGTGKELIARTIHQLSDRRQQAFVPVNCGAIPENLFESEFFGHRKGAFTGADRDKEGLFDRAHYGTLFLDEIGELSPTMQVKLLRALELGEYMPLGSATQKQVDVRIIAATNQDLEEQLQQKLMREDFFYRINVVSITAPPLRNRKEDIPLLIDHFLEQYGSGERPTLPAHITETLYQHDWPGNIRQLQNALQRYLTVKRLDLIGIRSAESMRKSESLGVEFEQEGLELGEALANFEKLFIARALDKNHWHKGNTAKMLGIPERTLRRKTNKYHLS